MNVKKFTAATTRDALRMVRDEYGDDAVILSNRKVAAGVEIMVMTNEALSDITQTHINQTHSHPGLQAHSQPVLPQTGLPHSRPSQPGLTQARLTHPGLGDIPQLNDRAEVSAKPAQFRQPS